MKTTHSKVIALMAFLGPVASSHAFSGPATFKKVLNVSPAEQMSDHDSDSQIDHAQSLQGFSKGLLYKAALVETESAKEVSNEPGGKYAREAESMGTMRFCGRSVGTFALYKEALDGVERSFLIGSSHGLYDPDQNGNIKILCGDEDATVFLDMQYENNTSGINHMQGYTIKAKPLNHKDLLKYEFNRMSGYDDRFTDDVAVFEIPSNHPMLVSQTGGLRECIKIASDHHSQLLDLAKNNKITLISSRANYRDESGQLSRAVTYEENCYLNNVNVRGQPTRVKKLSCDAGKGSSGAPIVYGSFGNRTAIALVVAEVGTQTTFKSFTTTDDPAGNYVVPAEAIKEAIDRALILQSEAEK